MKKALLTAALCIISFSAWSEDIIVTTDSKSIKAIITEVSKTEVRYKSATNPDGPVFVLETSDIQTIVYANGEVQNFNVPNGAENSIYNAASVEGPQEGANVLPVVDLSQFHGFLLQRGNCVYIPTDSRIDYERAAQERFKEIIQELNIWQVVDTREQSHFEIMIKTVIEATPDVTIMTILAPKTGKADCMLFQSHKSGESIEENIRAAEEMALTIQHIAGKGCFDDYNTFRKKAIGNPFKGSSGLFPANPLSNEGVSGWNIP